MHNFVKHYALISNYDYNEYAGILHAPKQLACLWIYEEE